jgi:hypothetical protein
LHLLADPKLERIVGRVLFVPVALNLVVMQPVKLYLKILAHYEVNQDIPTRQANKNSHCTPYNSDAHPSIFSEAG